MRIFKKYIILSMTSWPRRNNKNIVKYHFFTSLSNIHINCANLHRRQTLTIHSFFTDKRLNIRRRTLLFFYKYRNICKTLASPQNYWRLAFAWIVSKDMDVNLNLEHTWTDFFSRTIILNSRNILAHDISWLTKYSSLQFVWFVVARIVLRLRS